MARRKRFKPPKVENPPCLVEIRWVDAQTDISGESEAEKAGGYFVSNRAGYYVRYSPKDPDGPFVVLAMEYSVDEDGKLIVRDHTTIPLDWIVGWAESRSPLVQVLPAPVKKEASGERGVLPT